MAIRATVATVGSSAASSPSSRPCARAIPKLVVPSAPNPQSSSARALITSQALARTSGASP